MRRWIAAACLLLAACGSSPSAPSPLPAISVPIPQPTPEPAPAPRPIVQPDPALFDAAFNAQLVHNAFDAPAALEPSRRLTTDPSIYLQRTGLSDATVAALEAVARAVVPAMTGGQRSVAAFTSGDAVKPEAIGWITVELRADDAAHCGTSYVGVSAGHVWLNTVERCRRDGLIISGGNVFAHELGHAVGFYHVADPAAMMNAIATRTLPTAKERYHAGLAYQSNGAYSVAGSRLVID